LTWLDRFATRPETLPLIEALAGIGDFADNPGPEGGWSARQHLAHLARYTHVFRGRLERILREPGPAVGRYRAEEDPEWAFWSGLSWEEVLVRWRKSRDELAARLAALSPAEWGRTGLHPVFGELAVPQWLEFFLLHEGHHLYAALVRLGEARRRLGG
jgi:hypothetical protein